MTDNQGTDRPDRLSIEHSTVDGIRVVTLRGEIDHGVKDALQHALSPGDDEGAPRIVADLSGVTFIDSSGINVFIHIHQRADAAQGWLRLAGIRGPVMRVVQLVGLDAVVACHDTVEEALA
ncbi:MULTISPECIES: STAS domain-containing protein [Streptomyces]|uniref:STAS domain-containing protein n=1 Tax=Streptomyces TaxID=1883 RepID=UPI0020362699|nr:MULTISPECIES: STAS domain-containing protein [Streptomyces]UUA04449.1 STAS domain-containing protein [Streptomyces koelreuteriae]UUA12074.1 STAS domain-containing protein [Streptomyces sp. CRCS-T-1]